jgi:hypothetical protein
MGESVGTNGLGFSFLFSNDYAEILYYGLINKIILYNFSSSF